MNGFDKELVEKTLESFAFDNEAVRSTAGRSAIADVDSLMNQVNESSVVLSAGDEALSFVSFKRTTTAAETGLLSERQSKLLADVSVQVGVEIGVISLSAEQLLDMLPGQVLQVNIPSDIHLRLRIGADYFATAKFVRNGDKLALEIIEI